MRVAILFFAFMAAACNLSAPIFQKFFIDQAVGAKGYLHFDFIDSISAPALLGVAFALMLIAQFFGFLSQWIGYREAVLLQGQLSKKIYEKMIELRGDSLKGRTVGEVVSIYATDVPGSTAIIELSLTTGATVFFPLVMAPIALGFLFDVNLGLLWAVSLGVIALIVLLSWRQARFFAQFKRLSAERSGFVNEWVQNIRSLRVLGWVRAFEKKIFIKRDEETANRVAMVTNGQVMASIGSSISFFMNLIGVSAYVASRGAEQVTPGEILALLWILGLFMSRPFRALPWVFTFSMDGWTSLKRVERFLKTPIYPQKISGSSAESLGSEKVLQVRELNLQIEDRKILDSINLDLNQEELIAIVGEVGSGKSMLAQALLGEVSAEFGSYSIAGKSVQHFSNEERRKQFCFVPQDGFVASTTLRNNVAFDYEAPSTLDLQIKESLRAANFMFEQEHLAAGLDTEIGERGVNLSGGQKQRVGLARAHFYDRPIVILDDSLSAVDVDTEAKLLEQLINGEWKTKARILITHRLSVLPKVDRVIFMDQGRIVDVGSYAELLSRSALFQKFTEVLKNEHA